MAIYCFVSMVNTFLKYSLISGAILTIDFAIFCQVKELWNISEKDWLNLSNQWFLLSFFTHKNTQDVRAFMRSRNSLPWFSNHLKDLKLLVLPYPHHKRKFPEEAPRLWLCFSFLHLCTVLLSLENELNHTTKEVGIMKIFDKKNHAESCCCHSV